MWNWKDRLRASGIHLGISLALAGIMGGVFLLITFLMVISRSQLL